MISVRIMSEMVTIMRTMWSMRLMRKSEPKIRMIIMIMTFQQP